ncbi:hypothetical protein L207DRAFT_506248 [Hyaloscypha variabilis F]|uniref:Extracellular membrane protein CFEM domain-containing protein n=1 Tax=Hyaloscypha variabilis (strain UAMH 11265 / GT02V1 / F) TaxID=1149755 RepID=A0A2J6S911_HYAVF|nr:hypothetical protein L207DRAFT_506248 [Hyaloscypha variabilis F]
MSWLRFFLSLLLVSNAVQAQQFLNFTEIDPSECAAPAAYSACYGDVVVSTAKCVNEFSDNPTAQKGCGCTDGEGKINCFAQACWNRVYGCEYQRQVDYYRAECELRSPDIPFWPAPDNAPGGCSCNTGVIIETIYVAEVDFYSCIQGDDGSLTHLYECVCCGIAVGASALFDICPATNPEDIGLSVILNDFNQTVPWPSCGAYLDGIDCVSGFGYVAPLTTGSIYGPSNTPVPGTQTLFDEPGEVTAPPSGSVFTWYGYESSYYYAVTALAPEQVVLTTAAGGAKTTQAGATITGTGVGATSTTPGSGSGTTKGSAAQSLRPSIVVSFATFVLLGVSLSL